MQQVFHSGSHVTFGMMKVNTQVSFIVRPTIITLFSHEQQNCCASTVCYSPFET